MNSIQGHEPLDIETADTIRRLEESLWKMETWLDRMLMRRIFSDDLVEFVISGRIYALDDLLFDEVDAEFTATLPLPRFNASYLSSTVVQTTYVSELFSRGGVERANRSSIWIKDKSAWRLRFHQGTPVQS